MTPERTVGRLSLYRRLLRTESEKGLRHIFSHQLAVLAGVTAAQIRRDLMCIGYQGSPRLGYDVQQLGESIESYLSPGGDQRLALVGVGNLGRAVLAYFARRHRRLSIVAAFDSDAAQIGRVINGCRCYAMEDLADVVRREDIAAAIIAVPAAQAQAVADAVTTAGVTGILNFAPVSLRVSRNVYVEHNDLTVAIEKVAYFARTRAQANEVTP
ncbi:MAG: redox-sensing transcriptional repressor Rex [Acidobacteria bacterium]|nr:redox-sensing transcriptional repressor Rex [Planctomycetota bacterium]MBE3133266.1 redox-sensing transcriptional repressor Rex [Acidobacteriota bacterium]